MAGAGVARLRRRGGWEYRSEFHVNPSDEVSADEQATRLHFRTPDGKEDIALVLEGLTIYTPAGTPHSPRFAPDAYLLVMERKRREGEIDRFQWFCPSCDAPLHEEKAEVHDYRATRCRRPMPASSTAKRTAPASPAAT